MYRYLFFLLLVTSHFAFTQGVIINEVMSSNKAAIRDEDGDASDWIELYNKSAQQIDLSGYSLSDDTVNTQKWKFGNAVVNPGEHLLVFASDKNRKEILRHWETVISKGAVWKYKIGSVSVPSNWIDSSYDDSGWSAGPSGFGYGDNDDSTNLQGQSPFTSLFIRKTFSVKNLSAIINGVLHVDYDDGFVAYINGVEIARAGIGTPGSRSAWNDVAASHEAVMFTGGVPERFNIDSIKNLLREGENTIAIQVHNTNSTSTDLSLIPFLSFGMNEEPVGAAGSPEILGLETSSSYFHTNFKISASGESIVLSDSHGAVLDRINVPELVDDISYGRISDGAASWIFQNASPGLSNTGKEFEGFADSISFSHPGGFYPSVVSITLSAGGSRIFYTLNGSDPDSTKTEYSTPITIQNTTVLKAISVKVNHLPGPKITQTYFINEHTDLAVVSLSTDSLNLFDYNYGIYVDGPGWTASDPHFGANYWMDWERPAHIEFFDDAKKPGFSEECGVAIYGAWSRAHPQKSLAIKFKNDYGAEKIEYPLFPNFDVTAFKSLVLRNAGNDFWNTHIRDAVMQMLIKGLDIDYLEYRPATTFINGKYWGIYGIREKINEHYVANRYGVDPDNIDMLENNMMVVYGDSLQYRKFIEYISTNNMATDAAYNVIDSTIDLNECLLYFATQAYYNNRDWPGNNIKFWRAKSGPYSKWRWILFDLDFGFSLYSSNGQAEDHIQFMFNPNGTTYADMPWATLLQRKLVENPRIKNQFINLIADLLNTNFKSARVISKVNEMANQISTEIAKHRARFGVGGENLDKMTAFAQERPGYLRGFVRNYFKCGNDGTVSIHSTAGGKIQLNSLYLDSAKMPWSGIYFQNNTIHLKAIPEPGYKFDRWSGAVTSQQASLSLNVGAATNLVASFSKDSTAGKEIVFNEINYNSSGAFNSGDWIELYNRSTTTVDISHWTFTDSNEDHQFTIPAGTMLEPDHYLALVENDTAFAARFPGVTNYIGTMDFGLDGSGEFIKLMNDDDQIMDSLTYDDKAPWPTEPDGGGATLELFDPASNNAMGENWRASKGNGSPGKRNSVLLSVEKLKDIKIPSEYSLFQNYPNPFNPETTISFNLPSRSFVSLKIFDMIGKEVTSMVSEELPAGSYTRNLNASYLSSGVYFYRMQAGSFSETKKLTLLR